MCIQDIHLPSVTMNKFLRLSEVILVFTNKSLSSSSAILPGHIPDTNFCWKHSLFFQAAWSLQFLVNASLVLLERKAVFLLREICLRVITDSKSVNSGYTKCHSFLFCPHFTWSRLYSKINLEENLLDMHHILSSGPGHTIVCILHAICSWQIFWIKRRVISFFFFF